MRRNPISSTAPKPKAFQVLVVLKNTDFFLFFFCKVPIWDVGAAKHRADRTEASGQPANAAAGVMRLPPCCAVSQLLAPVLRLRALLAMK
jgi:hypothetical protein